MREVRRHGYTRAERRRMEKADRKRIKRPNSLPPMDPLSKGVRTYWNGTPTPAHCVRVRVGTVPVPTWWCYGLTGTVRDAVEVRYAGERFYLDNEDGSGWRKVTAGRGGPDYGHKSLPDDSEVVDAG